jgi:hypothetical protein
MAEQVYQDPKQKGSAPLKGVNRQQNNGGTSQEVPTFSQIIQARKQDNTTRDLITKARTGEATIHAQRRSQGFVDPLMDREEREQALKSIDYGKSKYDSDTRTAWMSPEAVQDFRSEQQGAFLKAVNGLMKGAGLFATTYLSSTVGAAWGLMRALEASVNLKGETDTDKMAYAFSRFWDNEVTNTLEHINRGMEEVLPNYYSRDEQENPLAFRNLASANFLWDKFVKNMGFTVGAMYAGKGYAKAMTSPQKYIGAMNKAMKMQKAQKAVANAARAAGKEVPASVKFYDNFKLGAQITEKVMSNSIAGTKIRGAVGALMNSYAEGAVEAVNNVNDWDKLKRQELEDSHQERIAELTDKYVSEGKLSMDDNGNLIGEGLEAYNKDLEKLEKEKQAQHEVIDIERARMGNSIVMGNMALLTLPEFLMFGKFYGKSLLPAKQKSNWWFKATQEAKAKLGNKGAKELAQKANKGSLDALTDAEKSLVKSHGKGLNKKWELTKATAKAGGKFISEAQEEMNQGIIAETAGQAASNIVDWKFNTGLDTESLNDVIHYTTNWFNKVDDAYEKKWSDDSWWEEGLIGGLTGLLGVPTFGKRNNSTSSTWLGRNKVVGLTGGAVESYMDALKGYKKRKADLQRFDDIVRGGFTEKLIHAAKQIDYNKIGEQALLNDDEFTYKTSHTASTVEDMLFLDRGEALDPYLERAKEAMQMSDEDVRKEIEKARETVATNDQQAAALAEKKADLEKKNEDIQKRIDSFKEIIEDENTEPDVKQAAQAELAQLEDELSVNTKEITEIDKYEPTEAFREAQMAVKEAEQAVQENESKSQQLAEQRNSLAQQLEKAIQDGDVAQQEALQKEIENVDGQLDKLANEQEKLSEKLEATKARYDSYSPQNISPFIKEDGTEMSIEEARKVINETNSDFMELASHVRAVRQEMSQMANLTDEQIDTMTWYQVMGERIALENADDMITLFNEVYDFMEHGGTEMDEKTRDYWETIITQRLLKSDKNISYAAASEQAKTIVSNRESGNSRAFGSFLSSLQKTVSSYQSAKTAEERRGFAADLYNLLNQKMDETDGQTTRYIDGLIEIAKILRDDNKSLSDDAKAAFNKYIETAEKSAKFFDEMRATLEEFLKEPKKVDSLWQKVKKKAVKKIEEKKEERQVKKVVDKIDATKSVGNIVRQLLDLKENKTLDNVKLEAIRDELKTDAEKKKFEEAVAILDYVTSIVDDVAEVYDNHPSTNEEDTSEKAEKRAETQKNTIKNILLEIADKVDSAENFKKAVLNIFDIEKFDNNDDRFMQIYDDMIADHNDLEKIMIDPDAQREFLAEIMDAVASVLSKEVKPLPKPKPDGVIPDGTIEEEVIDEIPDDGVPPGYDEGIDEFDRRQRVPDLNKIKFEEEIEGVNIDGKEETTNIPTVFPPAKVNTIEKGNKKRAEDSNERSKQESRMMNDKDHKYINRPQASERLLSNIKKTVAQHYQEKPVFGDAQRDKEHVIFLNALDDYLQNHNAYNNSNALKVGDKLTFDTDMIAGTKVAVIKSGDKVVGTLASSWDVAVLNKQIQDATNDGEGKDVIDYLTAKRDYYVDIMNAIADDSIKNRKAKVNRKMGGEIRVGNEIKSLSSLGYKNAKIDQIIGGEFRFNNDTTMMSDENRKRMHGALFVLIDNGKGQHIPFTLRAASLQKTLRGNSPAQKYYTQQIKDVITDLVQTLKQASEDTEALKNKIKELNTRLRYLVPVKGLYVAGVRKSDGGKFFIVKWKNKKGEKQEVNIGGSTLEKSLFDTILNNVAETVEATVNYDFNRQNDAEYQEHMLDLLETNLGEAFASQKGEVRSVNNWFTFEYTEGNAVKPAVEETSMTVEQINTRKKEIEDNMRNAPTIEELDEHMDNMHQFIEYLRNNGIITFDAADDLASNAEKLYEAIKEQLKPEGSLTEEQIRENEFIEEADKLIDRIEDFPNNVDVISDDVLNTMIETRKEIADLFEKYKDIKTKLEKANILKEFDLALEAIINTVKAMKIAEANTIESIKEAIAMLEPFSDSLSQESEDIDYDLYKIEVDSAIEDLKERLEELEKQEAGEEVVFNEDGIKNAAINILNSFLTTYKERLKKPDLLLPNLPNITPDIMSKKESTLISRKTVEESNKPKPVNKGGIIKRRGHTKKTTETTTTTTEIDREQTKKNIMDKFEETFGKNKLPSVLEKLLSPTSLIEHKARNARNFDLAFKEHYDLVQKYSEFVLTNFTHEEYLLFKDMIADEIKSVTQRIVNKVTDIKLNNIKSVLINEFGEKVTKAQKAEFDKRLQELEDSATEALEDELYCSI